MTTQLTPEQRAEADIRVLPAPGEYGRAFDLHPALFVMTVASYFAFLGVMALAFMEPGLALPFVIFTVYIAMAFGTPALWAKVAPPPPGKPQSWDRFMREGVHVATGHISGGGAVIQVLLIPGLIVAWAVAIAIIAASV